MTLNAINVFSGVVSLLVVPGFNHDIFALMQRPLLNI